MVHRKNRRYHDRVARRYDRTYDTPYWRFYREISWRHLRGFLPKTRPALAGDLGCGTGWFGRKLLKSGLGVLFVDPSGAMLGECRLGTEEEVTRGLPADWIQAELEDLGPIESGSLDFATAQGDPLSFCEEPRRALGELHRVLKPGASAVLSVDSRIAGVRLLCETSPKPDAALEMLRTGRSTWLAKRSEETFPIKMFDPDELVALLRKTGFEPLSTIGKTCLVQRANEPWLADPEQRLRLLRAEEKVHRLPQYLGLASHIQVVARRAAT